MKRRTLIATGIAVAAVLAVGGGYAYSAANSRTLVGTAEAAVAPLSITVSASGSLVAGHSAGIYPPAAGTIARVLVHEGDTVATGDTLAVMAKGPLKLTVAQARAAHTTAMAQLAAVNNGVPGAIDRSAANAALSAARSQVSTANQNYRDFADHDTSAQRKQMLRTLRTAKAQANAALKAAHASLNKLSVASRVSLARTAAEQGVSATAQALEQAELNLSRAELNAPFAGTVTVHGTVEKGSGLTPGVAAFTVVDPGRMEFEASVNETDISAVAKDQPATVSLDAFADDNFTGKVSRVQASAQTTATGTIAFGVRVSFDAGQARLFAGMSGSADIEVKAIPDALSVPIESVVTEGTNRKVFVLGADNVAHARQVTVGASTDTYTQVLTGVEAGDRVVTTGASSLADGQQVRTS